MRKILLPIFMLALCFVSFGCASSAKQEVQAPVEETAEVPSVDVDCDLLMQEIIHDCLSTQQDASTEEEKVAAVSYCECFAQLSFQVFGCTTIYSHQSLSDEEWEATYSDIFAECEVQHPANGALEIMDSETTEETTEETTVATTTIEETTQETVSE